MRSVLWVFVSVMGKEFPRTVQRPLVGSKGLRTRDSQMRSTGWDFVTSAVMESPKTDLELPNCTGAERVTRREHDRLVLAPE